MVLLRLAFPVAALAFLGWALASRPLLDAQGDLTTAFAFVPSLAVAFITLGGISLRAWRRFSLWLALAIVGQAAALQLINAGKQIHYQHYRGWEYLLTGAHPVIQAVLLIQLLCVLVGIAPWAGRIIAFVRDRVGIWGSLALAAMVAATTATVSREIGFYAGEIALGASVQLLSLGNIFLVAATMPESLVNRIGSVFSADSDETARPRFLRTFSIAAALWVFVAAGALSWFSYERFPHIADEVVYLYPARYFAAGMLTMPSPPVSEAFEMDLMTDDGERWYSPVPPGWPAVLALSVSLGAPWLVNPLLAALGILLLSFLVERVYDPGTARLAVFLAATSPWYLFLAMSFMTQTATLTMALFGAAALVVAMERRSFPWGLAVGLATGFVALIRPLDGVIVAGALGLAILLRCRGLLRWKMLVAATIGGTFLAAAHLAYNQHLTGSPLNFPLNAYFDAKYGEGVNDLGFGPDRGIGWEIDPYPGHGLRDVIVNTQLNTSTMNTELHGWAVGSLLTIALLFLVGRPRVVDWYLLVLVGTVVGLYSLYWFSGGPDFGPRYWFLAFLSLITLSARGISTFANRMSSRRAVAAGVMLAAMAVVNYLPWRSVDKYFHYRGMRPDLCRTDVASHFGRGLVLIRGEQFPDYMSAATCNPIDFSADQPIFAWNRGARVREQLATAFPDRPIWVLEGPSRTGGGFEIVEHPKSPRSLGVPTQ